MSTAKKATGARLRAVREEPRDEFGRVRWSREKWAIRMRAAAGPAASGLPAVSSLTDMIKQWERGDHVPGLVYRTLYLRLSGKTEKELFECDAEGENPRRGREEADSTERRDALKLGLAAAAPEVVQRVLRDTAAEAMEFTRRTGVTGLGAGTFTHLDAVLTELDGSYGERPPAEVFSTARLYRKRVAELIDGPRTLKQARELFVYAAWLSEALAWLAHDLGDPLAAEAWAIDAYEHADQAGHDELCAWAANARASITFYDDHPELALDAARQGIAKAPPGHPLAVRLRAQAARAYGCLGWRQECESMLREAGRLHERQPAHAPLRLTVETSAMASFALTSYPCSAYLALGDPDKGDFARAKTYALATLSAQQALPEARRTSTREAIARIDLGLALTRLGEPEEAAALGCQALRSPHPVHSVRSRAGDLARAFVDDHAGLPEVREFREMYRCVRGRVPA
ncbi:XRE family transcriptional regulator [Actinomadura fibrosa]|uniref:XRE family transcriptional regulator n=1 Tax=Actinomadura fibrosa TaxID=111802 RepID=A0ABW2XPK1_9ACTN|nr:XRE family transcriptional regulator [Actinomadura fibrosa]